MNDRVRHNHITRDIKPKGVCPACDITIEDWEKRNEKRVE